MPHDVAPHKQRSKLLIVDKVVHLTTNNDDEEMAKDNQVRLNLLVFD